MVIRKGYCIPCMQRTSKYYSQLLITVSIAVAICLFNQNLTNVGKTYSTLLGEEGGSKNWTSVFFEHRSSAYYDQKSNFLATPWFLSFLFKLFTHITWDNIIQICQIGVPNISTFCCQCYQSCMVICDTFHYKNVHVTVVIKGWTRLEWCFALKGLTFAGFIVYPANTRHWPNVVLMLGRRRRRRANIRATLGQCECIPAVYSSIHFAVRISHLDDCWLMVCDVGPAWNQCTLNVRVWWEQ